MTLGYHGNPSETSRAFFGDWFRTGDIGYRDEEGNLFIVDREKDFVKYKGHHISPTELENLIASIVRYVLFISTVQILIEYLLFSRMAWRTFASLELR